MRIRTRNIINTNNWSIINPLGIPKKEKAESTTKITQQLVQYQNLVELGKELLADLEVDRVLKVAMDRLIEISEAERGLIILFDKNRDIIFETARNLNKQDVERPKFEVSRTIINKVKIEGIPLFLKNAYEDPQLKKSDSVASLKILSVICLPLKKDEEIFGVIYLDNRTVRGVFKEQIFEFVTIYGDFISLAAYNALERKKMKNTVNILEAELRSKYQFEAIIGSHTKMMEILRLVSQVAVTKAPVLIEGESGTGKELIAKAIHFNSPRHDKPFVCMDCGAIPDSLLESSLFGHEKGSFTGAISYHKGKFELADGGTLFLDEVDEMSPALQVKLLRILQWGEYTPVGSESSKKCDVRIVAASKQPLQKLVSERKFRDDLYYRLNIIRIELPPLRERKEDIPLLINHILQNVCKNLAKPLPALSPEVKRLLRNYSYPGNIRELENIIKHAAILCHGNTIELEHLPIEIRTRPAKDEETEILNLSFQEAKKQVMEDFERRYLCKVLQDSNGIISKAAKLAGMHEKNFHTKIAKYGIRGNKT